jgi:hypothetical protein
VALGDLDTLWVQRRSTQPAAVAGAVVGALVFGAAGLALGQLCDQAVCERDLADSFAPMIFFGVIGAGVGAVAGALLGSLGHYWQRRYP